MAMIGGRFEVVWAESLEKKDFQGFSQKKSTILRFFYNSMVNIPSPGPKIIGLSKFT